ncbi:hypothetical protein EVAR_21145_1 [Eumeta japonica]|uniref:Mos1 transposase HTH domain-containing protein n=1 Tax=Eumeta variegata TaxID=151549 RepID=A0A4C1VUE4_EUMVA|nr:hypothetical protein EVAR_21145_1 [Eumeta japonica]
MRATKKQVVTAAHGRTQSQRSHRCIAGLLDNNRISDGEENRAMEARVRRWRGSNPSKHSLTGRRATAETVTSRLCSVRGQTSMKVTKSRWSPPTMDTRNSREVASALFTSWIGIEYLTEGRGLIQKQCINQLTSAFRNEAPLKVTIYHWFSEFNRERSMLTEEFKEGRPKSVVVPHSINAVRKLMMQDRHVTYREIKASLGIKIFEEIERTTDNAESLFIKTMLAVTRRTKRLGFSEGQRMELLGHPPYNTDLAPEDLFVYFNLFPSVKNELRSEHFSIKKPLMVSKGTFWRYLIQNGKSAIEIGFSV